MIVVVVEIKVSDVVDVLIVRGNAVENVSIVVFFLEVVKRSLELIAEVVVFSLELVKLMWAIMVVKFTTNGVV